MKVFLVICSFFNIILFLNNHLIFIFKNYLRDAPEATGEEAEDADFEMPKIYEPVIRIRNE